jgi:glycerophosphoryl diester phosphodiesterase
MRTLAVAAVSLALGAAVSGGGRPLVSAHRGGALLWPENSLTAFRGALGLGVDLVELDVHLTKDGEVVVIHDPTLERTTSGRGAVRDHAWADLRAVTVQGTAGEPPPRLEEVLDLIRPSPVGLLLEIKAGPDGTRYPAIEERVLRLLDARGLAPRTTVMAFDWAVLERLRELSPTVRLTGLLARRGADRLGGIRPAVERLARLMVNDLGIERTLLTPDAVAAARAAGLTIGVWTVNEPDELKAALAAGVDYVTTDRPDLALRLRGQP